MKRGTLKTSLSRWTVVLIVGLFFLPFFQLNITAQRRGRTYNRFDHNVAAHQRQACAECHKSPTGLSAAKTLTGESYRFPDITDYPDHDACLDCHRQQFFRGARPAICSICHTKVSPRDKARFPFSKENQGSEFRIRFPHDVHQDIIARTDKQPRREESIAAAHFINAKFSNSEGFQDEKKTDYNNCTICHAPATAQVYTVTPRKPEITAPQAGMIAVPHQEKFPNAEYLAEQKKKYSDYTVVGHFKTLPNGHESCFNCHYSEQNPVSTNCKGCHEPLTRGRFFDSNVIERYSLKFNHDLPETHAKRECAFCHVRITQSESLRSLKPDVPIFTCSGSSCHTKQIKGEISQREDKEIKSCSYCHGEYIGSYQIPESHKLIK